MIRRRGSPNRSPLSSSSCLRTSGQLHWRSSGAWKRAVSACSCRTRTRPDIASSRLRPRTRRDTATRTRLVPQLVLYAGWQALVGVLFGIAAFGALIALILVATLLR